MNVLVKEVWILAKNISINLGKLSHNWQDIPLIKNVDTLNMPININGFSPGIAINIGNPHIVFFGNNIEAVDLSSIGPKIENNELFVLRKYCFHDK